MKTFRTVWLFAFLASRIMLAQSSSVTPAHQSSDLGQANGVSLPNPATQGKIAQSYGKLPLSFEANQGQTDARVKFLSRGFGYTLFLTGDEAVFSLRGGAANASASPMDGQLRPSPATPASKTALRMKLLHASLAAKVTGTDELPGKSNYFLGSDPKKWRSSVPTYAKVKYEGIYPGVDLIYYGKQRQLEYDFVVAPGADPHRIQFDLRGAKRISRDGNGDLVLGLNEGEVRWQKPIAYQEKDGTRQEIAVHYVIRHKNRVAFELAEYDSSRPLFIDPLVYSTYFGIAAGYGIAVDSSGNAYLTGDTDSSDFPTTSGAFQTFCSGFPTCSAGQAFVSKLNPAGSALIYSTYLGSTVSNDNGSTSGLSIAVDSSGNAYVTGSTGSTNFPTMNPLQASFGGGFLDAFVTKLDPSGSALVYSTYLGGSGYDTGSGIAVDGSGNAYVTGYTASTDFPTMNPLQPAYGGGSGDAFVAQLNPTGSAFVYSTYLGGSGADVGSGIAVDASGNAYVTGDTDSTNFPTMNPLQPVNGGGYDAFVTELNSTGSALIYSTYLGGSGDDFGTGILVDGSGDADVTGYTASTNFPTMNPLQPANGGGNDAFVSQLNPTGSALLYSTYLGGSGADSGAGIALDGSGNTYVIGSTTSTNFPTMNPLQPANAGGQDVFVTELNPTGSALVYSTYLGGSGTDVGAGIAADGSGNAYVTGATNSPNFPLVNPLLPNCGSDFCVDGAAFVAQISHAPVVTLSPSSLNFGNQNVGTTSAAQNVTLTNSGNASLSISSIVARGDFAQTNTCPVGGNLAAGSKCAISVTFTPSVAGMRNGAVTITDSASNSPQTGSLSGTGAAPAVMLSPPSVNFGDQPVGTPATAPVTLTNTGNAALTISSIAVAGANPGDFSEINTCGTSVGAAGTCQITVKFTPTVVGARNATINITDNGPGSPQMIILAGTGTVNGFAIAPASGSPTSAEVTPGNGASFTLTLTPSGSFGGTVNLACSVSPVVMRGPTCTLPTTVQVVAGTPANVPVTVNTTASTTAGTVAHVSLTPGAMPIAWAVFLFLSAFSLVVNRRNWPALAAPVLALAIISLAGCGGSGSSSSSSGTPLNTYAVTVTATSGSLTSKTTVTVHVQ